MLLTLRIFIFDVKEMIRTVEPAPQRSVSVQQQAVRGSWNLIDERSRDSTTARSNPPPSTNESTPYVRHSARIVVHLHPYARGTTWTLGHRIYPVSRMRDICTR